jgi:hypothetical protein
MATPTVSLSKPQPSSKGSVAKVAAQRYLNKASGRMETANQIHTYHAPAPRPVPPAGHTTSGTSRTTTRTVTHTAKAPVSFINKTPAEVEATARQLTAAEVSGIRAAYQPSQALLGQQQQGALNAHATSQAQLTGSIGTQQAAQAGSAKTFENYAADAINSAATAAPGAAQTAEHLGLKPGEALPESAQRQQEAARTLLSGIAQSGATGTNARQQDESNFLTNLQGSAALSNAEGAKNIEGSFLNQKGKVTAQEGQALAKASGNTASLAQKLFGEQEKDRIAAAGLNYKGQEVANRTATTTSTVAKNAATIAQGAQKNATAKFAAESLAEYRTKTAGQKQKSNEANETYKAGVLKELGRKNKIAEEKAGPGGTKISAAQKAKGEKEMTTALNAFERAGANLPVGKSGKSGGRDYQRIRNELTQGEVTTVGGKEKMLKGQAVNPIVLNAMEQVFRYHYVNPETKKALAAIGLPSEGLSNLLLRR